MRGEFKRSLSRILIAAMLLSTVQSSVVSAATELADVDSVSGDRVFEADVRDAYNPVTYEDEDNNLTRLRETLDILASVSEGRLVTHSDLSPYLYNVNADAVGEPDVVIEFEPGEEPAFVSSAKIFRDPGATVSGDVYTVSAGDAPYSELKFTFYNTVFWYHAATYADGSVSQPGYGGFKTVSDSIVNDWDPAFVISGHKLSEAISEFPKVVKTGYTLKYWGVYGDLETDPEEITLNTNITKPFVLATAVWEEEKIPHIHEWEFDKASANVVWTGNDTDGYTQATIKKTCKSVSHNVADDGPKTVNVSTNKITVSNNETCGEQRITYYTATFDHEVDEAIPVNEPFSFVKTVSGQILKHKWKVDSVSSNGSYETAPTTASMNIVCERDRTHTEIVTVSGSGIELLSSNELKKIYKYTGTASDGQTVSVNEEFTRHIHIWKVDSVSSNGSYEIAPTTASLNIVCERDGAHKEIVTVSGSGIELVSSNELKKIYKYTGTASDGQTVSANEEFLGHTEHKWTVSFNWISISSNKADTNVTAEAICKVGGEKKSLEVTLTDKQVSSKIEYLAKATDPAGRIWKEYVNIDTKTSEIKYGPAGIPSVEGGDIVIIGVEETYPYTGSKIKPAVTVMDGDIVLAQSTDYIVSYTGKNKIGEINKVEVKGKGNYAGKSTTVQFKIVDPREGIDEDKLGNKVSKVSVNTKKFTYNGKAQYPSEVTVTLKDKSTIVYKVDEDGNYTTDSDKKVGLSFSNNINKGTATVAAMGSDGKVKKATFKIEAADIAPAEFEISPIEWAVKAGTPDIKATIKLGDEDVELVAGQDYKVSFKAKVAGENKGTAKISSKGNFKGQHTKVTYTVTPMEITESNIVVKAIAGKRVNDVKVTVNDAFGNALNKKFYTVEIQNAEGTALNWGAALPEKIKVVVKGAYAVVKTGDDGVTVNVNTGQDISRVEGAFKVDKNFYKTYTGEPITIKADDFGAGKIVVGELKFGEDFKIVGYKNNVKKGTMIVTVQGEGEYGGTKTFKVKIKAKPFDKEAPKN